MLELGNRDFEFLVEIGVFGSNMVKLKRDNMIEIRIGSCFGAVNRSQPRRSISVLKI